MVDKDRKNSIHTEQANVIDQLGTIFVVAFVFALILAYSAYGKLVQERLAIDNVAKEYLYRMEEKGYLTSDDKILLEEDMESIGVKEIQFTSSSGVSTTETQVAYGDKVTLALNVEFINPLYATFSTEGAMIKIFGFEKNISYDVIMSSTAKW